MINVSWNDAKDYVAWPSPTTGKSYRLLHEVEWECAARADSTTRYPWGNYIGKGNVNCINCGRQWGNKQTTPSGSFKAMLSVFSTCTAIVALLSFAVSKKRQCNREQF